MRYYQREGNRLKFSRFVSTKLINKNYDSAEFNKYLQQKPKRIEIIAYCLMPTHIHFILKQLKDNGISIFMNNLCNSYSRYFNTKHKRKGPLWEGRFKKILVESDEHLLHLTRYVHLNPVTAHLVNKPENWQFSSYFEYSSDINENRRICNYGSLIDISFRQYKEFVENGISYQRELAKIKNLILE